MVPIIDLFRSVCLSVSLSEAQINDMEGDGEANLRNLMLWHYYEKQYTLQKLPWLSILKEFKLLTPHRKRTTHRPFSRPVAAPAPAPI